MASVRFVFDSGDVIIPAETDRSAKLIMSGFRRKMEAGDEMIDVKGKDGVRLVNAGKVNYIEIVGGSARSSKPAARGGATAKKTVRKAKTTPARGRKRR